MQPIIVQDKTQNHKYDFKEGWQQTKKSERKEDKTMNVSRIDLCSANIFHS